MEILECAVGPRGKVSGRDFYVVLAFHTRSDGRCHLDDLRAFEYNEATGGLSWSELSWFVIKLTEERSAAAIVDAHFGCGPSGVASPSTGTRGVGHTCG
jgi:hypothetical protein